jgi:hypothetical protein
VSALEEPSERREPQWTLGDRLRKSRLDAEINSTARMATLLNARGIRCGGSTVGAWENDVNPPRTQRNEDGTIAFDTFDILRVWADLTNVPYEWLAPNSDYRLLLGSWGITDTSRPTLSVCT